MEVKIIIVDEGVTNLFTYKKNKKKTVSSPIRHWHALKPYF